MMDRDQRNHAAWLAQQEKNEEKIRLLELKVTTADNKCHRLENQLKTQKSAAEKQREERNQSSRALEESLLKTKRELDEKQAALESSQKQRSELQRQVQDLL